MQPLVASVLEEEKYIRQHLAPTLPQFWWFGHRNLTTHIALTE